MVLQGAGLLLLCLRVPILAGFDLFDSAGQVFVVRTLLRTAESMAAPCSVKA
jgi:hypothetical protein